MPRVAIVARSSVERARWRGQLAGADIEIVGEGPAIAADLIERADVLVVVGDELLAQALDWIDDDETLAVVGLVPRLSPWAEAAGVGGPVGSEPPAHPPLLRGWALLADDTDRRALRAAIVAADAGLASWPMAWAPRAAPADVRIPFAADDGDEAFGAEALTPREQEVLELLSIGLSNRGIAVRLGISGHTVKFHVAAIYGKLGVSGRTAAVNRALRRGILKI